VRKVSGLSCELDFDQQADHKVSQSLATSRRESLQVDGEHERGGVNLEAFLSDDELLASAREREQRKRTDSSED
jgi:hypothetical protein